MGTDRPIVLSIAGFDPSAGAGILADIKTFEQHKVYGLGICTAQTIQTENHFFSARWEREVDILQSIDKMLSHYKVSTVKIGIVESIERLGNIVSFIHQKNQAIRIVIDTVIKSSSGFDFWKEKLNEAMLQSLLLKTFLITPNYNEVVQLTTAADAKTAAQQLSAYCNVLLKGGHNIRETGVDYLYLKNGIVEKLTAGKKVVPAKHGSGCVLSAAVTANLAHGNDLVTACGNAKEYTEQFLNSNTSLLGYHHV